jgi:hypothetical protein
VAYAAFSPELEDKGGVFICNNEQMQPHPLASNEEFQRRLWEISHEYLQIEDNLCPDELGSETTELPPPSHHQEEATPFNNISMTKTELDFENGNASTSFNGGEAKFSWEIMRATISSVTDSDVRHPPSFAKPYYEYFISNLFTHLNLNKTWFFSYLEIFSIFLLHSLDKFNSQFKLFQFFE